MKARKVSLAVALCWAAVGAARADAVIKADNADNLALGSSWVGGVAPGTHDVATWNAALAASKTYSLGAELSWLGMAITADPGGNVTFNAGNTLTLGAQGLYSTPNRTVTLNCAVVLGVDQTWYVGNNTFIPQGGLDLAGRTLTLSGAGKKEFKSGVSGGGRIVNSGSGSLFLTGSAAAAPQTEIELGAANLTFSTSSGLASGPRTKSLLLNSGATVSVGGRSDMSTVETNANELAVGTGTSTVTIAPNAAKSAGLYSGRFLREVGGGAANFRGTALGAYAVDTLTANSTSVLFGEPPALLGANGAYGSTTNSILPGAVADTNLTSSGMGLATYDAACGLRPLDFLSEYTAVVSDGQSQLDNVRYANVAGSGVMETTLTQDTRINSLSFNVAGTSGDGGVLIAGDAGVALTIASGCIYASQVLSGTPSSNDVQLLTVPFLDLGGQEGVIFRRTAGVDNGLEQACLDIRSSIRNDGGKGVTFVGPGLAYLGGSAASAYTGPTVCQSGNLRISKSAPNIGIPGKLVIKGGTVQNTGNQIADSADIAIHGGSYYQKGGALNSGSGAHETFRDLLMTGGTYIDGASGTSSGSTSLTNASLGGGTWSVTQGHSTRIGGHLSLSGGLLSIGRANDTSRNTTVTVVGRTTVSNALSDAYTPVSISGGSGAGVNGGRLVLQDDVAFVGRATNTNPVMISASAASSGGLDAQVRLDGVRTFDMGGGGDTVDAVILPVLADNGAVVGGLTKLGPGTLTLMATNAYTGGTTVGAGALVLNGSLVSPVTVSGGALLAGTGVVSVASGTALTVDAAGTVAPGVRSALGVLSITGDVSFASGAVLRVDVDGAASDLLAVSGAVVGGPVQVHADGVGEGPWRVLAASAPVAGAFVSAEPGLTVYAQAGGAELWLGKRKGTLISVK